MGAIHPAGPAAPTEVHVGAAAGAGGSAQAADGDRARQEHLLRSAGDAEAGPGQAVGQASGGDAEGHHPARDQV